MAGRLHLVCGNKLNSAIAPLVADLPRPGLDVVLEVPDGGCRERLRRRNAAGGHEFAATDSQFDSITRLSEPPGEAEGLAVVRES